MGISVDTRSVFEPGCPPETLLVKPAVELDLYSRTELASTVDRALRRHPLMVAIDLREVEFIDSAALFTIVSCLRHCDAQGVRAVVIRGGHGQVTRLIELTGIEELAEFIDAADLPPFTVQID